MWIASTLGWFSIVADSQRNGYMLVRARCRQDIWNLYEMAKDLASVEKPTSSDESRDYRHRMSIDKPDLVVLVSRLAAGIKYFHFKSEVARHEDQQNKLRPYHNVWAILHTLQSGELPDKPAAKRKVKRKAK